MKLLIFFFFILLTFLGRAQDCPESCSIYIPNVVTPNCDGIDCEFLTVSSECPFISFDFKIFNRWGVMLFESDDPEVRFDSSEVEQGAYVWMLEVTYCNEREGNFNGQVTVVK